MDEQDLKKMLSELDAPEPSKNNIHQAVSASMAAFDEKNAKKAQGYADGARPTDNGLISSVRRFMMQKRYLTGLTGGVAVCALVAVLGGQFFEAQMERIYPSVGQQASVTPMTAFYAGSGATQATTADFAVLSNNVSKAAPPKRQNKPLNRERRKESKKLSPQMQNLAQADMAAPIQGLESAPALSPPVTARTQGLIAQESVIVPVPMPAPDILPDQYQDEGRDKFEKVKDNNIKQVSDEPVSTFSIDVDTASYAFMRRQLNNGRLPHKDSVRVEELVNYFDYNYPLPEAHEIPFQPTVTVLDSPWRAGNKLVHIGIKGYDIDKTEKPRSNLVFLIDTSGSMNSRDKLPLLKNAFKLLLETLDDEDTIGIVTYAGSAGVALEPTKASDKRKIFAALDNLRSGGGTAGAAGLKGAYALAEQNLDKDGVNRVILATDGDFNIGISNRDDLKDYIAKKRDTGISLSVLGFGQGNYNDALMQALAQNGNGNAAYIDSLSEARKVLVEEAASTMFTIAGDVKIQVEFNPQQVKEYRLVGYETRHLNREDFNNDKIDAGEIGAGHTVTAIYEISPVHGGAHMVDPLRYGQAEDVEISVDDSGEYAFLKMRYKLPGEKTSKLITQPISSDQQTALNAAADDVRFSVAVASFGQMLKAGVYTGDMTYDDIIDMANNARGEDPFGYRSEFVNLVRLAKSASAMGR